MKADSVYLRHVLDAIAQIEEYVGEKSFDDFERSRLIQDGVIRQLGIVGEAARRVSDRLRKAHRSLWRCCKAES